MFKGTYLVTHQCQFQRYLRKNNSPAAPFWLGGQCSLLAAEAGPKAGSRVRCCQATRALGQEWGSRGSKGGPGCDKANEEKVDRATVGRRRLAAGNDGRAAPGNGGGDSAPMS
jgi:hypothetical protein